MEETIKTLEMQRTIRQEFHIAASDGINNASEDNEVTDLTSLLKKTWYMWAVSSLYGFNQMDQTCLKLYGKRLREELGSILPGENVTYEAKFTVDEEMLPGPISTNPLPTWIEVNSKSFTNENEIKCIYNGILLSWGSTLSMSNNDSSTKLPLLLCKGTKTVTHAVHSILTNMFDCSIIALNATEEDLKWLLPISLGPYIDKNEKSSKDKSEISLEFVIPGIPESNSINFKFETIFLTELWSKMTSNDTQNINQEIKISLKSIEEFYAILYEEITTKSGLQLGLTKLHKISLPTVTIMDQRIKASTYDVLNKVLLYFNEQALILLHSSSFDSTVSS